jgi:aerobic carbon-monoxide dehydrogenase medium subunit
VQVPAPFEYARATSVDHALSLLETLGPEARLIAGGHSLLPMMKLRLATPEHLIDINDLADLAYIREEASEIRIGALTRHRDVLESPLLAERFPIFAEAERNIADPVVRNRGTVGGSICQADPAEDLPAICTALGARAVIRGSAGERAVSMDEFELGPYETALGEAEMLVEVRLPVRQGGGSAYEKVKRRAGDWAIAAVGTALWIDGGTIRDAGVALGALGPTTLRAARAEEALRGQAPSEDVFAAASGLAAEEASPAADQRGPVDYKRHLARELTHRALRRAAARALHQEV